ncbi:hypothetical protein V8C35DRAFT_223915 [Trichoderma chlorosporum]
MRDVIYWDGVFFSELFSVSFFFLAFPYIESSRVYDWLLLVQFCGGGLWLRHPGRFFFFFFFFLCPAAVGVRCETRAGGSHILIPPKNRRCDWIKSLTRHRNLVTENRQLTSDPLVGMGWLRHGMALRQKWRLRCHPFFGGLTLTAAATHRGLFPSFSPPAIAFNGHR